jgi:hypothetical protein
VILFLTEGCDGRGENHFTDFAEEPKTFRQLLDKADRNSHKVFHLPG